MKFLDGFCIFDLKSSCIASLLHYNNVSCIFMHTLVCIITMFHALHLLYIHYILMSTFCERPFDWGNCQLTPCSVFAKGPRFLNMVMTFVLHPLSHYNSITKSRAQFLFSLRASHYRFSLSFHSFHHRCI